MKRKMYLSYLHDGKIDSFTIEDKDFLDAVDKLFEKTSKPHRKWTPWKETGNKTMMGEIYVRENGKSVEMRVRNTDGGWIKSRATCHPTDKFNKNSGELLAYCRLMQKIYAVAADKVVEFMEVT